MCPKQNQEEQVVEGKDQLKNQEDPLERHQCQWGLQRLENPWKGVALQGKPLENQENPLREMWDPQL